MQTSTLEKLVLFSIVATVVAIVAGIVAIWPILVELNAYMALG